MDRRPSGLHNDVGCSYAPNSWGERYHWYSSTGWVMWNAQTAGLLNGTTCCIYDGNPGGAGFAAHGHQVLADWLGATREAIASCECVAGCPSCVQSPKCGNGNNPLDKDGALVILGVILDALRTSGDTPA